MAEVGLCWQCGERPCIPSRLKTGHHICARCRNKTPAAQARIARYQQSAKRKAVMRRDNAKRIYVGAEYHSRVATVEHARAINRHVSSRMAAFRSYQRDEARGVGPDA